MIEHLHFVRPLWFTAFVPLIIFLIILYRRHGNILNWNSVCDARLLPYVLTPGAKKSSRFPLLIAATAASLCIIAAAGPAFEKLPKPVYREQSTLVILMDLSQSMDATDLRPTRLERAKLKLMDILKMRKTGQTALIVYAADAFVVTPLTDDTNTIASLVPTLETALMPSQGSHAYTAINHSLKLLQQTSSGTGDVLLITDDITELDVQAIKNLKTQGHRVSILAVGTEDGGPILLERGFLQDDTGAIIIPKLKTQALQNAALNGGGLYAQLQASDDDIIKLNKLFSMRKVKHDDNETEGMELTADIWQEEGPWLLLFVIPLVALWARKGWLLCFAIVIAPVNKPAYAEGLNVDLDHLWRSPDQKAMKAFNDGDNKTAAEQFQHNNWKASAYYRSGDYGKVLETLSEANSSDDFYNKGNALAQLKRYPEAIEAYDKALELYDGNEDAEFNRTQVKQLLEKQDPAKNKKDSDQDSEKSDDEQQDKNGNQDGENQKDDQNQPSENKENKDQQKSDSEDQEQSESEQKNSEQQDNSDQEEQSRQTPDQSEPDSPEQKDDEQDESKVKDALQDAQEEKEAESQKESEEQAENNEEQQPQQSTPVEEVEMSEDDLAVQQWLKRVPDHPENLLRRKFLYQYKNMKQKTPSEQSW